MDIAGIGTSEVLAWSPPEGETRSFLDGMPQAYLREDAALISDYSDMPGFDVIKKYPFAARQFQAADNPSVRLKVIMANRLPLEAQTEAWVGTTVPQSKFLERVIEAVIATGKRVTLAVKSAIPPRDVDVGEEEENGAANALSDAGGLLEFADESDET